MQNSHRIMYINIHKILKIISFVVMVVYLFPGITVVVTGQGSVEVADS